MPRDLLAQGEQPGAVAQTLQDFFPWCAEWADDLTQLFRRYVETKHSQQLLDYDDLLLYWHLLVREPQLAQRSAPAFRTC